MAIAYRNGTTAGNASGGNLTINTPTGTVDNDILVVCLYREGGTWTLPDGWTLIRDEARGTTLWTTLAWKRASSEGASYTFNLSSSVWRTAAMAAFSGCLTSGDVIDVSTGTNGLGYPTAASVTTTADAHMEVAGFATYEGNNLSAGTGTALTQGPFKGGCEIWYAIKTTAGATGSTALSPNTQTYASVTAALKIAAAVTFQPRPAAAIDSLMVC